jgi:hypothetical protein
VPFFFFTPRLDQHYHLSSDTVIALAWAFATANKDNHLMFNPLKLKKRINPLASNDLDDVIVTKRSLSRIGQYELPEYGLTSYPDEKMFDGIRSFQRQQNLKVDGIIEPDGPTLRHLGHAASQLKSAVSTSAFQKAASKSSGPTPAECDHLFYKVDVPVCNAIKRKRGKYAAANCFHSVAIRYAACRRGTPISELPPLNTWNN